QRRCSLAHLPPVHGVARNVERLGEPLLSPTFLLAQRLHPSTERLSIHAAIMIPIRYQGVNIPPRVSEGICPRPRNRSRGRSPPAWGAPTSERHAPPSLPAAPRTRPEGVTTVTGEDAITAARFGYCRTSATSAWASSRASPSASSGGSATALLETGSRVWRGASEVAAGLARQPPPPPR